MDKDIVNKALLKTFYKAQTELLGAVVKALNSNKTEKASVLFAKVKRINQIMIKHYKEWVNFQLPLEYVLWADLVEDALKRKKLAKQIKALDTLELWIRVTAQKELIKSSLWPIHLEAVESLIEESTGKMSNAINGIERNIRYSLGEVSRVKIQETLAQWLITWATAEQSKNRVIEIFSKQWVTAFSDRAGKRWWIARYAEMLTRTETIRAYNLGTLNQWVANGITKYRNLERADCCPICQPFRNKVLTVWKDRFPPHHPNCRGTLSPILE